MDNGGPIDERVPNASSSAVRRGSGLKVLAIIRSGHHGTGSPFHRYASQWGTVLLDAKYEAA